MKAAILYGPHDFRIEEQPDPILNGNDCLVKINACGVCHSEIHQWDVKIPGLEYPRHIGHEISGEIVDIGIGCGAFKVGDRVAAWVDGKGFANLVAVKEDRLFKMSDELKFEHAILEPVACTTNAVMRANIQMGDVVALIGTGFMGLIILQQLKLVGATKIIAIDIRTEMLELAKKLGADITINSTKENVNQIISDLTNGKGVDVSFEVGGVQGTLDMAAEICRMEGKLVIFGYHPGQRVIKDLGYWNWMAFNIINAHFRDLSTILHGSKIGMQLLNHKKINMNPLISHTLKLSDIEEAFELAKTKPKGFVKSVIVMQ